MSSVAHWVKKRVRARYGWMVPYELRNKILLGHTAVGLRRVENAEVRRLLPTLPGGQRPRARVATIILTYKRPESLLVAISSALAQTFTDQVIIVVDDGGGLPPLPDDPRVHGVSLSRNVHVAGISRNIGIRLTDSDYIAFLDDDNTWRPHHLEVAMTRLGESDAPDLVYTAMQRITSDGQPRDVLSVPFDRRLATERAFLDTNPIVARRNPQLRFSRLRRLPVVLPREDWELVYRYSRRHRVEHLPVITVDYLVNADSYWTDWSQAGAPSESSR
jgi:hypothetical protein